MNYLAHLYLAGDSAECLIGSILGDFVKGAVKKQYPDKVKRGIELHRKIDAFTDSHAMTRASRRLYSPLRRRFAGIIVDLCYDHFLYRHWPKFSDSNLDRFIARAYDTLIAHQAMLPQRLQNMIPVMVRDDWLGSYQDLSGVEQALGRLAKRVTNGDRMAGAIAEVKPHYRQLEMNFLMFFPDLIRYVNEFKSTGD
jgi:acyl carrier protein phosphodiesterase